MAGDDNDGHVWAQEQYFFKKDDAFCTGSGAFCVVQIQQHEVDRVGRKAHEGLLCVLRFQHGDVMPSEQEARC
ncbi:hypothetical protein AA106556_1080 [Neokomagataea tanensis NBRC 106556]|uniref:Uncharacterized protein n=1 Tax=Neokomagataea tanensis NBRC 106556 TaxID=1223519 RepID=A0ABQ0QIT7_9PROT|nr:hypothetical protein AA106556_1080 [Neokomagataea tanensis NBRC 106556]